MNFGRLTLRTLALSVIAVGFTVVSQPARAHIIPPEEYHPVAESYRRLMFLANLNPVLWERVQRDLAVIREALQTRLGATESDALQREIWDEAGGDPVTWLPAESAAERKKAAWAVFYEATRSVAAILEHHLYGARAVLADGVRRSAQNSGEFRKAAVTEPSGPARAVELAKRHIDEARQVWEAFAHEVEATDPKGFHQVGEYFLEMSSAIGSPGVLGVGGVAPEPETLEEAAKRIARYVTRNFGEGLVVPEDGQLTPVPRRSATFDELAEIPVKLPPGSDINKQVPRPRQILNMAALGVDESETPLIALGDMAFDSAFVLGKPSTSLSITCNTCHNKGVTNPQFFIPGLSSRPGTADVSSQFFSVHGNNGLFDPLDIPDLRGIRFTAPYGRDGRFSSLREFIRNGILHEFNGREPDPLIVDAILAYMNEFDFLPNPYLNADGTLNENASEAAKRGEKLFHKEFEQMNGQSCATCHIPSDHFLDRRRHDIGTMEGTGPYSRDRALDTPTLLGAKYTAPYFHDGSQPTLRSVVDWFNTKFDIGMSGEEIGDLTAYLELVGEGEQAYEGTPYYLDAELEEFSFFLSTYEFLNRANKPELNSITFQTVATEVRNHKWELQNWDYLPLMDRLARLMDEAYAANEAGKYDVVDAKVVAYRELYEEHADVLN